MRHHRSISALAFLLSAACYHAYVPPPSADGDGDGSTTGQGDCNDADPSILEGGVEIPYDGVDQDCYGGDLVDVDLDGWVAVEAGGDDCDDDDPTVNPAGLEIPYDEIDQDCLDGDLVDVDGDGYTAIEAGGDDCDDGSVGIHPGAPDDCGGGDQDCDGTKDEDEDADGDGFSSCDGDCDDLDPDVNDLAYDVAEDGIDQNCNGVDKGNCGDVAYDDVSTLWVNIAASDSQGYDCAFAVEDIAGWRLPEDADCSGGIASWSGSMDVPTGACVTGDPIILSGSFTLTVSGVGGCGSFDGSLTWCDGSFCDDADGPIGFTQDCIF